MATTTSLYALPIYNEATGNPTYGQNADWYYLVEEGQLAGQSTNKAKIAKAFALLLADTDPSGKLKRPLPDPASADNEWVLLIDDDTTPETAILRLVSTDLFTCEVPSSSTDPNPTPSPQPTLGNPTGVYGVGITASECRVHFNLPSGATKLGIQRSTSAGGPWTTVTGGTTGEATPNGDRAYVDGGLTANTRYYYQIRSLDDTGGFGSWIDVAGPNNAEIRTTN